MSSNYNLNQYFNFSNVFHIYIKLTFLINYALLVSSLLFIRLSMSMFGSVKEVCHYCNVIIVVQTYAAYRSWQTLRTGNKKDIPRVLSMITN